MIEQWYNGPNSKGMDVVKARKPVAVAQANIMLQVRLRFASL